MCYQQQQQALQELNAELLSLSTRLPCRLASHCCNATTRLSCKHQGTPNLLCCQLHFTSLQFTCSSQHVGTPITSTVSCCTSCLQPELDQKKLRLPACWAAPPVLAAAELKQCQVSLPFFTCGKRLVGSAAQPSVPGAAAAACNADRQQQ
jgi:hypothetical protein